MKALLIFATFLVLVETMSAQTRETKSRSPVATYTPQPVWPFGAHPQRTTSGVFMLRVRPDGTVVRVDPIQSTGYPTLDLASMDAFYKWRFVPGSAENVQIPIIWRVDYWKH